MIDRTPAAATVVATWAMALLMGASEARAADPAPASDPGGGGSTVRGKGRRSEPGTSALTREEAASVPGAGGDPLVAAQSLPSVARPAPGASQPVIAGAAPSESQVLVDGVEIPALLHAGGLRGLVAEALLSGVELVPAAFGPENGRAVGGLVLLTTAALPDEGVHGQLSIDLADGAAALTVAGGERVRLALAGRYGWLDRVMARLDPPGTDAARLLFPVPRYDDWQAKVTVALRPAEELALVAIGADDRLALVQEAADPAAERARRLDQSFQRVWIRYQRVLPDETISVQPWLGREAMERHEQSRGPAARLASVELRYGLRASWRRRIAPWAWLTAGLDWQGVRSDLSRQGSLTVPAREGDLFVFGRRPGDDYTHDDWSTQVADVAPWVGAQLRLGPVTLQPGLRIDAFLVEASRLTPRAGATPPVGTSRLEVAIDPRLAVSVRLSERISTSLAAGLHHQPPAPEDLSAVFGSPTLEASRAVHGALSVAVRPAEGLSLEVACIGRWLDGLAVRAASPTPPLAAALDGGGGGRAIYGQLSARLVPTRTPLGDLSGSIAWTVGRSERRDHPGEPFRLFDQDQTHVLTALFGWSYRALSAGLRLRYATGMPRTEVIGALYDARGDAFQPLFGAHNGQRLPDFLQLDARVAGRFVLGRASLELYLDVQNVTNRANAEEIVYRYDYGARDFVRGLPLLALAGAKVGF